MHARSAFIGALAALALLSGCAQRSITITSSPEGALVWLNDQQVGRTPVEVAFKWYGVYDVRLQREGFEPISTSREAEAPLNEYPVIDLVTAPFPLTDRHTWHFDLQPAAETIDRPTAERDLIDRASQLRQRAATEAPQSPPN